MIDRAHTESTLWRIAVAAFNYYPTKPIDEPGYSVDEDIPWCLEPLGPVDQATRVQLSELVKLAIVDPSAYRTAIAGELARLSG